MLDLLSVCVKSTLVLASANTSVERLYKIFHFQNDKSVNLYADVDGKWCLYLIHFRILPHSEVLDSTHLVCQQVDTAWFSRKRQTTHYEGSFDWSPQLLLSHWIRRACAPCSWWRTLIPPVHAPITRLASSDTLPHLRQLLNTRIRNLAKFALDIPHHTT